jgi:hypothetical protein
MIIQNQEISKHEKPIKPLNTQGNSIKHHLMTVIYMDESGDLGFDLNKKRTSKNFLITFLFSSKPKLTDKIVSKIFKSMDQAKRSKHSGTLHCSHEHLKIKLKMLNLIKQHQDDLAIMVIRLNKQKVYARLQNEKDVLYNYTTNILLDRIFSRKLMPGAGLPHIKSFTKDLVSPLSPSR